MLNGQPPMLIGQPAMPNQERQFKHLTYEQAKVTLDLGNNGIRLRGMIMSFEKNTLILEVNCKINDHLPGKYFLLAK